MVKQPNAELRVNFGELMNYGEWLWTIILWLTKVNSDGGLLYGS